MVEPRKLNQCQVNRKLLFVCFLCETERKKIIYHILPILILISWNSIPPNKHSIFYACIRNLSGELGQDQDKTSFPRSYIQLHYEKVIRFQPNDENVYPQGKVYVMQTKDYRRRQRSFFFCFHYKYKKNKYIY